MTTNNEEVTKLFLKDVPMTSRGNRIYIRNTIEENRARFEELYSEYKETTTKPVSFDEWMVLAQGVNTPILNDMAEIDALPADKYVEAIVTYKQTVARAHHKQLLENQTTTLDFSTWVKQAMGVEIEDIGRAEAVAELDEFEDDDDDYEWVRNTKPLTLVIQAEGGIFEPGDSKRGTIRFNQISPYAIDLLNFLKRMDFKIFLLVADAADIETIKPLMEVQELEIDGYLGMVRGNMTIEPFDLLIKNEQIAETVKIDKLITNMQPGGTSLDISGVGLMSFYWGDFVSFLMEDRYMNSEDVDKLWKNLLA